MPRTHLTLPILDELFQHTDLTALALENPAWPWWFLRILQLAFRAEAGGRLVTAAGRALTAKDLAVVHERDRDREPDWQAFLGCACELGLLSRQKNGLYRVARWRRWCPYPSDAPEATRERTARHRQSKRERAGDEEPGQNEDAALAPVHPLAAARGSEPSGRANHVDQRRRRRRNLAHR